MFEIWERSRLIAKDLSSAMAFRDIYYSHLLQTIALRLHLRGLTYTA